MNSTDMVTLFSFLTGAAAALGITLVAELGPVRVVDGDTIEIEGTIVRLFGIDAPELRQRCELNGAPYLCGAVAAAALEARIDGALVECTEVDYDAYGRAVGVCTADGEDLSAWMARQGWAMAYRRYSLEYTDEELEAINAGRGLWRGRFMPPWAWRKGERLTPMART